MNQSCGVMLRKYLLIFLLLPVCDAFAQVTEGLIAHYSFNKGVAENESGNFAPKAVGVSYGEDRFGNPASACRLHGNGKSYLNLGTSPLLKPVAGSFSIWVNLSIAAYSGKGYHANPVVLTKRAAVDDFFEAYSASYNYDTHKISVCSSLSEMTQISLATSHPIRFGEWHHLVMTYDDHMLCLYLDGKPEDCVEKNFRTVFLPTDSVMIGNSANVKNSRFFDGLVDDIRFYNRVLTPEEVRALYNEPDPNFAHIVLKYAGAGLLSLSGLGMLALLMRRHFKKEVEKQKEKNRVQRQMYEMETRVIKAQMNPHFIFNSMNSIQQFILADNTENANTYLVKFSRLLRRILESNTDEYITVENEVDILHRYVEIESLRFEQAFSYKITVDERVKSSLMRIPPMLVQPFVENAIWHGLLPKEGDKQLRVAFEYIDKDVLGCTIDDNGLGRNREKPQEKIKQKSLSIRFTHERLELMHKEWGGDYTMRILDKKDDRGNSAGTTVHLRIPIIHEPC